MRILVFHGYLLHGTGSNVYNARLAAALVRAGHEVHLLCQDRRPLDLDWVAAAGDWDSGELRITDGPAATGAVVYRPAIGGVLPVYVADTYDGVRAVPFAELTDGELDAYLDANVAAVRAVVERAGIELALANHLVMGPAVLARALAGTGVPYAVKIHGSALEYTVKPHPERFLPYAREGLAPAAGILTGSRHTAESLWAALDDPEVTNRTRLGPPGVDVAAFATREPAAARAGFEALVERLSAPVAPADTPSGDAFAIAAGEAGAALTRIDLGSERLVVFVGKLIASKGVELLLAAWPLVAEAHPDARLVVVGFGAFRHGLEALAAELAAGDLAAARARRAEDGRDLPELGAFLDRLLADDAAAQRYLAAAGPALRERLVFTGRLDHPELADLLPAAEALVTPSTFPEAFGMVAAEGAATGALPVVARHSGLEEVSDALAERVPAAARPWLAFDVGPHAVDQLAGCLTGWLGADADLRAATRAAIVAVTGERWSWDGVARTVVAAAQGVLDGLPEP